MILLTLTFTLQDRGGCCRMITYRHIRYYSFFYQGEVSIPLNTAVTRFSRLFSYRRKDRSPLSAAVTRFITLTTYRNENGISLSTAVVPVTLVFGDGLGQNAIYCAVKPFCLIGERFIQRGPELLYSKQTTNLIHYSSIHFFP